MNTKACYRTLKSYKYQLMEEFQYQTDFQLDDDIDTSFIQLTRDGLLIIKDQYAWDGASGPTFDTQNSMRASLVHDALYQLMRKKQLPQTYVLLADQLFREILIEDGMSAIRAAIWYSGLRLAAGKYANPKSDTIETIICVGNVLEEETVNINEEVS
jgi:hypothetical protein